MERQKLPVFVLKTNNCDSAETNQNTSSTVFVSSQHGEVPGLFKSNMKFKNVDIPNEVDTSVDLEQDVDTVMSELTTDKENGVSCVELEESVTSEGALGLVNEESMMELCGNLEDSNKESDSLTFGEDDVLMQHMDIREPLSKLRSLIEERLGCSLADHEFWLQDAQVLAPHKNLVDQCVQGEGIVQVNFQIKTDGDLKKINIVDVLKPTEDFISMGQQQFEPSSLENILPVETGKGPKNYKSNVTNPTKQLIQKIIDSAKACVQYGESYFSSVVVNVCDFTTEELITKGVSYHKSCYGNLISTEKIERAKARYDKAVATGKSIDALKRIRGSSSTSSSQATELIDSSSFGRTSRKLKRDNTV